MGERERQSERERVKESGGEGERWEREGLREREKGERETE